MNAGDAYFLVLYVVSVFQPMTRDNLLAEAIKASGGQNDGELNRQTILEALKRLIRRQLVIKERLTNGVVRLEPVRDLLRQHLSDEVMKRCQ